MLPREGIMSESPNTDEKLRILVADDDVAILGLVARHLQIRFDADVIEASNGQEALELARSEHPSLIILDVMMPGMSGWEVCRAIREDSEIIDSKVLMLTGIGERLNEMTSPIYGANDYLDKPFDLDELEQRLRVLLGES